eukprot:SAG31_NODE_1292_length_8967_cov_2.998985_7_plen_233_part_00
MYVRRAASESNVTFACECTVRPVPPQCVQRTPPVPCGHVRRSLRCASCRASVRARRLNFRQSCTLGWHCRAYCIAPSAGHLTMSAPRRAGAKPRLSLVERQQQLLEQKGFSKPKATSTDVAAKCRQQSHYGKNQTAFFARQERHLEQSGRRLNATASSRRAVPLGDDSLDQLLDNHDDNASIAASSVASRAPSLHPSVVGSVASACSESTIGAGDETEYWDFQHRVVTRADL